MRIDKLKNLLLVETKTLADFLEKQSPEYVFIPRIYSSYLSTKENKISSFVIQESIDYMLKNGVLLWLGQSGTYKPQVQCRRYGFNAANCLKTISCQLAELKKSMEKAIKKQGFVLGVCYSDFISFFHELNNAFLFFPKNPISLHYHDIYIDYKESIDNIKNRQEYKNRQSTGQDKTERADLLLEQLEDKQLITESGTFSADFPTLKQTAAKCLEQIKELDRWANDLRKSGRIGNEKPIKARVKDTGADSAVFGENQLKDIKFSSNLARKNLYYTDGQIEKMLEKNYPAYKIIKEKAAVWNEKHPNQQVLFKTHITRTKDRKDRKSGKPIQGGKIKKIGIRLTNNICSLTSNDLEGKAIANGKISREMYLRYDLKFDNVFFWDVNSSIPNVLNWLQSGTWNNIDWHQKLADEFGISRATAKLETMRALFDSDSEILTIKHLIYWSEKHPQDWNYRADYWHGENWTEHLKSLFYGRKKYLNNFKSELFFYESAAYMLFLEKIESKYNCKVDSCYDCFYFDKQIEQGELVETMKQCFDELRQYI